MRAYPATPYSHAGSDGTVPLIVVTAAIAVMTNVAMMSMEIYEASALSQIYARHGEIWLDICSRTCFLTARVVMRRRNMVAWLSSAAASFCHLSSQQISAEPLCSA